MIKKRKIEIILLTICLISCCLFYVIKTKQENDKIKEFENKIKTNKNYKKVNLNEYYSEYLKTNSLPLALNNINFPQFFDLDKTQQAVFGDDLILVNPKFYLDKDYIPSDLVEVKNCGYIRRENETMYLQKDTFEAFLKMEKDALSYGIELIIFSGYRNFLKQKTLYENAKDLSLTAKPAHSEHQTGYAIDIGTKESGLTIFLENTKAFEYLKNNAHKFGFILRYQEAFQKITGYKKEAWHFRYVGVNHAKRIKDLNIPLEEYIYNYTIINNF